MVLPPPPCPCSGEPCPLLDSVTARCVVTLLGTSTESLGLTAWRRIWAGLDPETEMKHRRLQRLSPLIHVTMSSATLVQMARLQGWSSEEGSLRRQFSWRHCDKVRWFHPSDRGLLFVDFLELLVVVLLLLHFCSTTSRRCPVVHSLCSVSVAHLVLA